MVPVHSSFGISQIQFVPDTTYVWMLYVWLFVLSCCTAHNWIFCRRRVLRGVTNLSEPCHVWHIPPPLLLIVSFFLFPNILQIFSYNRSFQHIQTPLHQRILKIEWVRGWKESLFRSARTSCRTFDSPPVRPSTRNNFSWVHRWAVTLPSGLRYPSNRIFSESWWCQLPKFGRTYKYKDKYRDKYKYRDK